VIEGGDLPLGGGCVHNQGLGMVGCLRGGNNLDITHKMQIKVKKEPKLQGGTTKVARFPAIQG